MPLLTKLRGEHERGSRGPSPYRMIPRENDALSVRYTHSPNSRFCKMPDFQEKLCWQLLCLEFMRVETNEVTYEESAGVHID
jgi:hypothetical protein